MKPELRPAPDNILSHRALHVPYVEAPYMRQGFELPKWIIPSRQIAGLLHFDCAQEHDETGSWGPMVSHKLVREIAAPDFHFEQSNLSINFHPGNLRGIHIAPFYKLLGPVVGSVFAAVIDLRLGSPTFGNVHAEIMTVTQDSVPVLLEPPGCGNSYMSLTAGAAYKYEITEKYTFGNEVGLMWNDPYFVRKMAEQGLAWPYATPSLSAKDSATNFYMEQLYPSAYSDAIPSPATS